MSATNPFDEYVDTIRYDQGKPVPNVQPRISSMPYRIAIIGEAPGAEEDRVGQPFMGMSGRFLNALLAKAGIVRDACFVGNICQFRPPGNDISRFAFNGDEIQSGLDILSADLDKFNPNLCLLLGKTAMRAANGEVKITDRRGYIFRGDVEGPFYGRKCLATYHPAACLREYSWTPVLLFDLMRARREGEFPSLNIPQRNIITSYDLGDVLGSLRQIKETKPTIAIDIEGYVGAMSCISIAPSGNQAFIVPFTKMNGDNLWEFEVDEVEVWRALSDVLGDPEIPKVLQNSLYDRFVLQYSYGIVVRGVIDDTMLKHWERFCELDKGLGFQTSIYTDEPYYKSDRKTNDREQFWAYCCKDSAVTYEINQRPLDPAQDQHYRFNMALLNPLLYMELRGIRYDSDAALQRKNEINEYIAKLQFQLDDVAGFGIKPPITRESLLEICRDEMCYKKDRDRPKKAYVDEYPRLKARLLDSAPLTSSFIAEVSIATKRSLNIKSPEFKTYLYDTLKLPPQYNDTPDGPRLTADYSALLKLSKRTDHPAVPLAIEIGLLRTRGQMLEIAADGDGRVRCGYNAVGTETGRLTCYTSPTGSGYNLQTIPSGDALKPSDHPLHRGMRDLFLADAGKFFFQCDLSGADGWTVAAHLAHLGDPTMLLDYRFGLKPAKILCYLLRHGAASLNGKSRDEIAELTKEVKKEDWDYFACKIGQHGTCYLMGPRKLATTTFVQSEGKVSLSERETRDLQGLFTIRYRVKLWHDATARALARKPEIVAASGHRRRFFGRREEILGQALAHEPQANTTYATNLAAYRLWTDPENRLSCERDTIPQQQNGGGTLAGVGDTSKITLLRIEPLHQVHDALCGQFKIEDAAWAVDKIKSWFDNKIIIAGQALVIPFEGEYGPSWGQLGSKHGGGRI